MTHRLDVQLDDVRHKTLQIPSDLSFNEDNNEMSVEERSDFVVGEMFIAAEKAIEDMNDA